MDRLNTELYGGFPWQLDDWRWEINAHRDAIAGLCKGLQRADGVGLIVSGLDVTLNGAGGVLSISPGWMVWGGEPFYFPGGTGNGAYGPTLHFLQRDIRYDAATSETFEDGTVNNAYEIRRLKLVANGIDWSTTADAGLYASIGRISRLRDTLWPSAWTSPALLPGWGPEGFGDELRVRREGLVVRLQGKIKVTDSAVVAAATGAAFGLPVGLRPPATLTATGSLHGAGTSALGERGAWIHVLPDGEVRFVPRSGNFLTSNWPIDMACSFTGVTFGL